MEVVELKLERELRWLGYAWPEVGRNGFYGAWANLENGDLQIQSAVWK